jgi:hypothetical protein
MLGRRSIPSGREDEPGITGGPDEDGPYEKIQTTLESAKEDYLEVEILLRGYCSKELDS